MGTERHLMMCVDSGDAESLFECTVVLDRGLSSALHHGSTGLVDLSGAID